MGGSELRALPKQHPIPKRDGKHTGERKQHKIAGNLKTRLNYFDEAPLAASHFPCLENGWPVRRRVNTGERRRRGSRYRPPYKSASHTKEI